MGQCPEEVIIEATNSVQHHFTMQCRKKIDHKGYCWYSPSDDGESWEVFWKSKGKTNFLIT